MHKIYRVYNKKTGKSYIGQTRQDLKSRWADHKKSAKKTLTRALVLEGVENFEIELLEECEKETVDERERYWITEYRSTSTEDGYNVQSGGKGGFSYSLKTNCNVGKSPLSLQEVASIRKWRSLLIPIEAISEYLDISKDVIIRIEKRLSFKSLNDSDFECLPFPADLLNRHNWKNIPENVVHTLKYCLTNYSVPVICQYFNIPKYVLIDLMSQKSFQTLEVDKTKILKNLPPYTRKKHISQEMIHNIRAWLKMGHSIADISRHTKISATQLSKLKNNQHWSSIPVKENHEPPELPIRKFKEVLNKNTAKKLTEYDVLNARCWAKQNISIFDIAEHLGVSDLTIRRILWKTKWKEVKDIPGYTPPEFYKKGDSWRYE